MSQHTPFQPRRSPSRLLAPRLLAALRFVAPLVAVTWFAAPAQAHQWIVREESSAFPAQDLHAVDVEAPLGTLTVLGTDGNRVEARLEVRCRERSRRCRERAANLRLRPRRDGDELSIEVVGYPKTSFGIDDDPSEAHLEIRVPRHLAVHLELGVGEVEVRGMEADVDVELGVGEAQVTIAEAAVRDVAVDVGVGEAGLSPRPSGTRSSRFLFLGNEIDWHEGLGDARVSVEVGVGEGKVRLQP